MEDMQRMAQQDRERSLTFLTEKEYWSLPHYGRWLLDWKARWQPKTCQLMKKDGELAEFLTQAGEYITEFLGENYNTLGLSGGLEIVREMYFGEPEPDADKYWGIAAY